MPAVLSTMEPQILNSGNVVSFSLPILNTGSVAGTNVFITKMGLGTATRVGPGAPVFAGTLGVDNLIFANGAFSADALPVGSTAMITIDGTYQAQRVTYGFQVNRFITIPPPAAPPITPLQAQVSAVSAGTTWSYTISNNEPASSPQQVSAFSLDIVAPVTVKSTPPGWQALTDGASYVLWYANDNPNHVRPGASLTGFFIQSPRMGSESTGFALAAWNHQSNQAGLVTLGAALSPSRTA
jgi:hypothetical protein